MAAPQVGDRLAHFRLVRQLGRGGMGVVFEAEDGKLGRRVALKLLPPDALGDPRSRARFVDEARAAAAVSHPNLVTVYEIGEDPGAAGVFIAMELVDGVTLRRHAAGRALPPIEVARFALPVAEALAKAHRAGVVHRDIKPDNIMLTVDGQPKLLDFGLARVPEHLRGGDDGDALGDTLAPATEAGAIFGTPAYMSPEQARGQRVDGRSDVYSLGATLYEALAGRAPFAGVSPMDLIAAVIRDTPPSLASLVPELPPELLRIVDKCVDKDPAQRYQDAAELAVDLRRLLRQLESQPIATPPSLRPGVAPPAQAPAIAGGGRSSRPLLAALAVTLVAAPLVFWLARSRPSATATRVPPVADPGPFHARRLTHIPDAALILDAAMDRAGARIVFQSQDSTQLLDVASQVTKPLPVAAGTSIVSWTPDGSSLIGESSDAGRDPWLIRIPLAGDQLGAPVRLAPVAATAAAISPDGGSLAYVSESGLYVSASDGSAPRMLQRLPFDRTESLAWSDDGGWLAVGGTARNDEASGIELVSVDKSLVATVVSGRVAVDTVGQVTFAWTGPDRLTYASHDPTGVGTSLVEVPIVLATGRVAGDGVVRGEFPGYQVQLVDGTRDGRRLLARFITTASDTSIAELPASEGGLGARRRILTGSSDTKLYGFSDDGSAVYYGFRNDSPNTIYRQALDGTRRGIVTRNGRFVSLVDGRIVIRRWRDEKGRAEAQFFLFDEAARREEPFGSTAGLAGRFVGLACPRRGSARCVEVQIEARRAIVRRWSAAGPGAVVASTGAPGAYIAVAMSPDGNQLAISDDSRGLVRIDLRDGHEFPTVPVPFSAQSLGWIDARSLVAAGVTLPPRPPLPAYHLARIGLDGSVQDLATDDQRWLFSPIVSADGKHLAWSELSMGSNLWMLER